MSVIHALMEFARAHVVLAFLIVIIVSVIEIFVTQWIIEGDIEDAFDDLFEGKTLLKLFLLALVQGIMIIGVGALTPSLEELDERYMTEKQMVVREASNDTGTAADTGGDLGAITVEDVDEVPVPASSAINTIVTVQPIEENELRVEPLMKAEDSVGELTIGTFTGDISKKGQTVDFKYTPQITGQYRFEFRDIVEGVYFTLKILNSNGGSLASSSYMNSWDGFNVTMDAGEEYTVRVGQDTRFGDFHLLVGEQKPTVDVSSLSKIRDSIQYKGQRNNYAFTPTVSGYYRFEFSDVTDGTYFSMKVCADNWASIGSNSYMNSGDAVGIELEAGVNYYISVIQESNYGSYALNLFRQKEELDVSAYSKVTDSVEYRNQKNVYSMVTATDGRYRFELSNVPDGVYYTVSAYNSDWGRINHGGYMNSGDGLDVDLEADKKIYVVVQQESKVGTYSLNIGRAKPVLDVTNIEKVSDSIQYCNQRNVYSLVAAADGDCRFELVNVSDNVSFNLIAYSPYWETLDKETECKSGSGFYMSLKAGEHIYVVVEQYRGVGSYTLNLWRPMPTKDITDAGEVKGYLGHVKQVDKYVYRAKKSGKYVVKYNSDSDGTYSTIQIEDEDGNKLKSDNKVKPGNKFTVSLDEGQQMTIKVSYYWSQGEYTLSVNKK